jgi:hypothetical protein
MLRREPIPMLVTDLINLDNKHLDNLILTRCADKISTGLEEETVILDIASGNYSGLDQVGTTIWNLIEEPRSFRDICQKIMAEFDVKEDVCRKDLVTFLNELAENKLITVENKLA